MRAGAHSLFYALGVFLLQSTLGPNPLAAAADPLRLVVPSTIYQCHSTVFSWSGGTPPYVFSYAPLNEEWTSRGPMSDTSITLRPPKNGTFAFRISDNAAQNVQLDALVLRTNDCNGPTLGDPLPASSTPITHTNTATRPPPLPHYPFPSSSASESNTSPDIPLPSSPPSGATGTYTPTPPGIPESFSIPSGHAPDPTNPTDSSGPPISSPTNPPSPSNPSGPSDPSDPSATTSPDPNSPSQTPPQGAVLTTDSTGNTVTVIVQTGANGQVTTVQQTGAGGPKPSQPIGTAAPIRNTQADDSGSAPMSSQAKGAIIGTIVGGFALFLAFLLFRWRRRHQRKHQPIPILPRTNSSHDDLMVPIVPPYSSVNVTPPMSTISYHHPGLNFSSGSLSGSIPPSPLRPAPSFTRFIPPTKQPLPYSAVPARHSSDAESDYGHRHALSRGTWNTSETGSSSHVDSMPGIPADGPEFGVDARPHDGWMDLLQQEPPHASTSTGEPVSLQRLIGRELNNIYSHSEDPTRQLPSIPLRGSARLQDNSLRLVNVVQASGTSGSGTGSRFISAKQPRPVVASHDDDDDPVSPSTPSVTMEGRGGVQLTRRDMEYLADLVAARLTHNPQRGEELRSEAGVPPPSYV